MALVALVFQLAILALVGVSIYEHVTSVKLSLPLSPALTFLTILLPLLAAGNTFLLLPYQQRITTTSSSSSRPASSFSFLRSPRFIQTLQVLQGMFITILATLYFQDLVPSAARDCELSTRWQHLFRAKDELSIRAIQDALDCCGFRSVQDMAWPFPPAQVQCAARFERARACRQPWMGALQRSAGVNFGVVLAVGLLQILSIFMARQHTGRSSERFSWGNTIRRALGRRDRDSYTSRPLLTSGETQTEEIDEEIGRGGHENGHRYGTTEDSPSGQGPRIEPSGLRQEQNEWRDG